MAEALQGIKVIDLSRILAGPWASQILADMGAQVIKVEQPNKGDDTRFWGPPLSRSKAKPNPLNPPISTALTGTSNLLQLIYDKKAAKK